MLRRSLCRAVEAGPAYVPFIGDGDLAVALYVPRGFTIWGADIDQERVDEARRRLPGHTIIQADCDDWPFPPESYIGESYTPEVYSLADFDAYSDPYAAFRSFWTHAQKASPLSLAFTDGHRQGIIRSGTLHHPSGEKRVLGHLTARRRAFNFYWQRIVRPWFVDFIKPWRVRRLRFYLRGASMLYWGAVIYRTAADESDDRAAGPVSSADR